MWLKLTSLLEFKETNCVGFLQILWGFFCRKMGHGAAVCLVAGPRVPPPPSSWHLGHLAESCGVQRRGFEPQVGCKAQFLSELNRGFMYFLPAIGRVSRFPKITMRKKRAIIQNRDVTSLCKHLYLADPRKLLEPLQLQVFHF